MDTNYTLRYRTFDQLLEDVSIDLNTFALENMIEPQQLIKVARKLNYDLGLRINQTREAVLEITHGRVKLPDNFYTWNYGLVCGEYKVATGYGGQVSGTNIIEVPYNEFPNEVNTCNPPTVNCVTCNSNPCNQTAACEGHVSPQNYLPTEHDPNNPYGNTCIRPRVFMNCKGETWEIVQVLNPVQTRVYRNLRPLKMKSSQNIDCECPNLYYNTDNQGWLKDGYLFTTFQTGSVYINYQGDMVDDNYNLLVPDHELINDYYEYALKKRILENLLMNGEDVAQRLQYITAELRAARNNALSLVNTPNFKELEKVWWTNRRAQYSKYYDMFKSHNPNDPYWKRIGTSRLI
jgi:hypothetical protein